MEIIKQTYERLKQSRHTSTTTIDRDFYTDESIFDLEVENVLKKSWHMVCRLEDVGEKGDYYCDEFIGERFFILHGCDNKIRAFANVCRHRWSTLLNGSGTLKNGGKAIICPYHKWCYDYSGNLMESSTIKSLQNFNISDYGLHKIRISIWNNFIFISLSDETEDFKEYVGEYDDLISSYHKDLVCVRKTKYDVNANWKNYIEVDMETYHTSSVHPESIGVQKIDILKPNAHYIGVYHVNKRSVALYPEVRHLGFPFIEGLSNTQKNRTYFCVILPSLFIVNTQDSMWWIHKVPVSVDKTEVRCGFAFPKNTIKRKDFNDISKIYYRRWDKVIEEDNWIVEEQYKGIKSQGYAKNGRFVDVESVVFDFNKWVLSRIIPTRK